ncbi:T9SS type A sorting domain-containing protein [Winogradskyella ouciana]|uniref:T9SS type A sorting domain-containing protein n=1 Tax=Winogradskyella ouciana TaxID=2608631 RepID=A0A7K1GFU3_9FLAO|nr:T9SS type A sorting domain-containing protein [Winogradskyella ouciana]MTE28182.1 T9SS type A sorting domain-containing protein [Winogradskyella ouciana]
MKLNFIFSFFTIVLIFPLINESSINLKQKSKDKPRLKTEDLRRVNEFTSQGQLRLSLYESSALANNESATDALLILFDTEGNNAIDANDALHIPNLDENFATNNNGILLSVENRNTPQDGEEIQLEVNTYRNTDYTIVAEGIAMQCATAFLFDNYTHISTEIPQSGTVNYSYSITSGTPASIANDRFEVVFASSPLQITWNGFASNNWNDPNNWIPNQVPDFCSEITIPVTGTLPILSGDKTITDLNIHSGANLIVSTGATLNIDGDLNMYSESDSYSGLILKGTIAVSGTSKYHRYTNSELNGNDLIAPPLSGQSWTSFLTNDNNYNSDVLLSNGEAQPNTTYLFGPFEKGNTDDYLLYNYNTSTTLSSGTGYRVGTDTSLDEGLGEALIFTGSIVTGSVNTSVENDFTGDFPEWNLIGNPYPSYLDVDAFLNHVGSVSGVSNLSLLDEDTAAIYGYDANNTDGSGSNWTITNLVDGPTLIAPGQGFFVSSNSSSADLEFTPNMQTVGNSDDFIIGRTSSDVDFIKIRASTASDSCLTSLFFHDNASLGLDRGFDAAVFGGNVPEFALYSHLVANNEGVPMAIQTVNSSNLSDVVIPLGVNVNQGEELTFSIADMSLPASINVYLDDTLVNTSTLLINDDYVMLPTAATSGTGRFFLRISEDALSTTGDNLHTLNIFVLNSSKELIVSGRLQENTQLDLFDIQGRKVLATELNSSIIENRINIASLSGGIYIVNLQYETGQKSKKVVIK